jgi:hypothetical protein
VLVRQLPASSRLGRAQIGYQVWSDTEYLLAGVFDLLAGANWQRSGGRGPRPRPVRRPGDKAGVTHYGKAIPFEEAKERLRRRRLGIAG